MAGYFDDEEDLDAEEQPRDTVVTLSWGAVAGMGFALLLVCGLCFGLGYLVGHRSSSSGAAAASASQAGAPDQEPLEGNGSAPKPPASAQAPVAPPETSTNGNPALSGTGGESPEAVAPSPAPGSQTQGSQGGSQEGSPATTAPPNQPQVRPALPGYAPQNAPNASAPGAPQQAVSPAMPTASSLMVQVAAVKNAEDASVLTDALRKRGYPVSEQREAIDGLIHVRVGPFATRDEAIRWRDKLLGDGYNAIVQP